MTIFGWLFVCLVRGHIFGYSRCCMCSKPLPQHNITLSWLTHLTQWGKTTLWPNHLTLYAKSQSWHCLLGGLFVPQSGSYIWLFDVLYVVFTTDGWCQTKSGVSVRRYMQASLTNPTPTPNGTHLSATLIVMRLYSALWGKCVFTTDGWCQTRSGASVRRYMQASLTNTTPTPNGACLPATLIVMS